VGGVSRPKRRKKADYLQVYSNLWFTLLVKDVETKTKIYAEVGIPEYWVVNLKKRQLIVFRDPQDGDYASKFTLTEGTVNPIAFPDIIISVSAIVSN
jgi:Uma2 family endonuclease